MVVVGEASGDMHAAKLVKAIREIEPATFFCGIGGSEMKNAGVKVLVDAAHLAAVGVTESVFKLPVIIKGMRIIKRLLRDLKPDLIILVDFPDFNMRIAPEAKKLKIPVLYYISPQIWAWRQGRAAKLAKGVDHLAVILPFEEEFYRKYEIPVTFVGHPLMDEPIPRVDARPGSVRINREIIGLLPGSRQQEVERHLPIMLGAARLLLSKRPAVEFLVSVAYTVELKKIEAIVGRYGKDIPLTLVDKGITSIFEKADLVMATSGTVTLEVAIRGIPEVILYRVSPLSYWFGKMLVKVNYIGLANLIAGREIVPELIQDEANPDRIAHECDSLLKDNERMELMKKEFEAVRNQLGNPGASKRTAEIALRLMRIGKDNPD